MSKRTCYTICCLTSAILLTAAASSYGRSVYLNGVDVSSSRNQVLQNVNVRIDEHGNVFIEGRHYRVHEEAQYTPLSRWLGDTPASVKHRPPREISTKGGQMPLPMHQPATSDTDMVEKLGDKG